MSSLRPPRRKLTVGLDFILFYTLLFLSLLLVFFDIAVVGVLALSEAIGCRNGKVFQRLI